MSARARLTPEPARRHHRGLVLQALYRGEGLSRADSGPLDFLDGVLLDSAVATIRGRTLPEIHGGSDLRLTALGRDIVVLGAAVMVLMGQRGVS